MAYVSQEMKKSLSPAIKAVLKKYNMKGTIAVYNHSALVVNLKEGLISFEKQGQVNTYWVEKNYEGVAADFLSKLVAAMKGPKFFDNSDIMTDYFDVSHYININIGSWKSTYKVIGA